MARTSGKKLGTLKPAASVGKGKPGASSIAETVRARLKEHEREVMRVVYACLKIEEGEDDYDSSDDPQAEFWQEAEERNRRRKEAGS